jgi:transcriptional regulator of acetoin/glycerol metabolism
LSGTVNDTFGREARRPTRAVPYLLVALECDRPLAGGARYSLAGVHCVTLGRGTARDGERREERGVTTLDVRVPAEAMSSKHARFLRVGETWVVEDCQSKNGTYVNGARVERAEVRAGDVVAVGRTLLMLAPPKLVPVDAPQDADGAESAVAGGGHATIDPALGAQLLELDRVARSSIPVLVRGETGTGKELLARAVHQSSGRPGPFVAVNCGAIPAGLVESHLFGHVKGAFSGAVRDELGVFRASSGGTLFLDEIGDLPTQSQAALLRALQEREVVPVGASRAVSVDLRVVAATHQPLDEMVARGDFRRDLLARLSGFSFELPPLRDRRMDMGLLLGSILRKLAPERADAVRFTALAGEALLRHDWPLNTRELEQCLARALVLAGAEAVDSCHLPAALAEPPEIAPEEGGSSALSPRDESIRRELLELMARHRGSITEVAREMGKARMQVHRWCRRFGVDPNLFRK